MPNSLELLLKSMSTPATQAGRSSVLTAVLGLALALWLVVQLPAFLCMGVYDPNIYDVLARRVMKGDVLYRDLMETNFPGIVWAHLSVRTLFGWSTEALRAVDVVIVGTTVVLLLGWLPRPFSARVRIGVAAVPCAFYLSTTEWCHCQRDVWMLPVCLVALGIRCRQTDRLKRSDPPARLIPGAVLEGAVWAAACWVKPFAAVPGLVCWLLSARHVTAAAGAGRRLAADFAGLLVGGLAVGGLGAGWLAATGAWDPFLDVMFDWNREYFTQNMFGVSSTGQIALTCADRFFPWCLVHFAAIPFAVKTLFVRRGVGTGPSLRAGFYLAWLLQSLLLQHWFDYVHVPAVLLGLTLLAAEAPPRMKTLGGCLIVAFFVLCIAWRGGRLTVERAEIWSECVSAGGTPDMKFRTSQLHWVPWPDLARAAEFLRTLDVRDGEVCCFTDTLVPLYNDLDVQPSTRFVLVDIHLGIFKSRRDVLLTSLALGRQRYLVCTVIPGRTPHLYAALSGDDALPGLKDRIVFRSGAVVVFRLDGAEVAPWLDWLLPHWFGGQTQGPSRRHEVH
jgi:hypothetical protein